MQGMRMNNNKLQSAIADSIRSIPPAAIVVRGQEASWLAEAVIAGMVDERTPARAAATAMMDDCLSRHMPDVESAAKEFCENLRQSGAHVPAFAAPLLCHIMRHHLEAANKIKGK
jgi:hypothetical protein